MTVDLQEVRRRIEAETTRRGLPDGWRLLYSPAVTANDADVSFIGLNPGGKDRNWVDHPDLHAPAGTTAYTHERWGAHSAGDAPLQRQVKAVLDRLAVPAAEVLAGNLVPFRTRDWARLPDTSGAIMFGKALWRELLTSARPSTVVTMGEITFTAIHEVLNGGTVDRISYDWGAERARAARFDGGRIIGLPHLSRRKIMQRDRSQSALDQLFA